MEQQSAVVEHWTVTRRGLVLAGKPADIETIANRLHLPDDALVEVTPSEATLALWGEVLDEYRRTFGLHDCSGETHRDELTDEFPQPGLSYAAD